MSRINEKHLFLLEEVVRKNFSSKYKDSYLGIVWSVLNPLLMVLTLTAVFATILGKGIPNYPVYLLSGRCIYSFIMGTVGSSMSILRANKGILQKNAIPKHIFIVGSVISEFLNFIILFVLLLVVMVITQAPFHFSTMIFAFIPVISAIMLITGCSLILSVAAVYYTDIKYLWSIVSQMMLYTCAIFYRMDAIPDPFHQFLILNPIYWLVEQFRDFMMFGIIPNYLNIFNSYLISSILLVLGIVIFYKYEDRVTLLF